MLVICNGMIRSGSTLQYNLARTLIESMKAGVGHGFFTYDQLIEQRDRLVRWGSAPSYHLIKSHEIFPGSSRLTQAGLLRICYIYRDIRDVAVSVQHGGRGTSGLFGRLDRALEAYYKLKKIDGVLWQRYEVVIDDLVMAARSIAKFLNLNPSEETLVQTANQCSLETAKQVAVGLRNTLWGSLASRLRSLGLPIPWKIRLFDEETLLHYDHISEHEGAVGVWRAYSDEDQMREITRRYGSWLTECDYLE